MHLLFLYILFTVSIICDSIVCADISVVKTHKLYAIRSLGEGKEAFAIGVYPSEAVIAFVTVS